MLTNKTSGKKILEKVVIADQPWTRLKGLMFEDARKFNYALVFVLPSESKLEATIHMLFVFFPIDVVFLDRNRKVVDIVKSLKPFTPGYTPAKPARYFVELPADRAAGIKIGDELEW